jgi:catechol 2,3-dioxygenase-like lactoylglutathione lyase family enzyme
MQESLISAANHVAVLPSDLDRFVDFYGSVLGLELILREEAPPFCHAILRCGAQSWLHPVQLPGKASVREASMTFERAQLDHLALTAHSRHAFDEIRRRLAAFRVGLSDVEDLGAFHAFWFSDPDGMPVEVADAVGSTDVLLPDEQIGTVHQHDVEPHIRNGASPAFALGFTCTAGK